MNALLSSLIALTVASATVFSAHAQDVQGNAKAGEAKTPEEKQAAGKAVMEATKAAILKADASLESVFKAIEEARAKGKGKGDKGGKGKKPEGDKGGKKPEAK